MVLLRLSLVILEWWSEIVFTFLLLMALIRVVLHPQGEEEGTGQGGDQERKANDQLGHVGSTDGVDSPGNGSTTGLDALVETGITGQDCDIVGESTHQPVDVSLPGSIVQTVEHVQEQRSDVGSTLVEIVVGLGSVNGEGPLEKDTSDPSSDKEATVMMVNPRERTGLAVHALVIEDSGKRLGANDLGRPIKDVVQGLGTDREVTSVDSRELVRVKPVGGQEHGDEDNHAPVQETASGWP